MLLSRKMKNIAITFNRGVSTMNKIQMDSLIEKYGKHLRLISKEKEDIALSYDETEESPFTISIELTKDMVKDFIKYYNLTCLYEYLSDGVMFTKNYKDKREEYKEYDRDLDVVLTELERIKNNFYKQMAQNFKNHTVAICDFEDENVGEYENDLMTRWADNIETQTNA